MEEVFEEVEEGESLVQVAEVVGEVLVEKERMLVELVPSELAAGWLSLCCDDMPCEHQGHVWRDKTYSSYQNNISVLSW